MQPGPFLSYFIDTPLDACCAFSCVMLALALLSPSVRIVHKRKKRKPRPPAE